jgi:hypothetical protein
MSTELWRRFPRPRVCGRVPLRQVSWPGDVDVACGFGHLLIEVDFCFGPGKVNAHLRSAQPWPVCLTTLSALWAKPGTTVGTWKDDTLPEHNAQDRKMCRVVAVGFLLEMTL